MKSRTLDVIILFPPLSAKSSALQIPYINGDYPATDLSGGALRDGHVEMLFSTGDTRIVH
jgi:hypothetical protein